MSENVRIEFINSEFTAKEAKELLMDLLTKKVKFHETKNFSSLVRFGTEDEFSMERIQALNSSIVHLREFFDNLEDENLRLTVRSGIQIELKGE